MKKIVLVCILVLILSLCACTGNNTNTSVENNTGSENNSNIDSTNDNEMNYVELIEGYPEDILPLYKSIGITSCEFIYREDYNYIIGKDVYSVEYDSEADVQDISDYFHSLFTTIDEDYDEVEDFEGTIGDNYVIISLYENDDDSTTVNISLGLAEYEYVEENPYFSDYPDELIEVYGFKELQEITYQDRNYFEHEIRYLTIYKTDITEEQFIEFYKSKYGSMDNFYEDKDEYRLLYMWENKGFECSLTYTSYNDGELSYINICAVKKP